MIPVLVFLENWGKSGKLGPIVQNNGHQYTESHTHFTSNEALLKYKYNLRVDLHLFKCIWGIGENQEICDQIPKFMGVSFIVLKYTFHIK